MKDSREDLKEVQKGFFDINPDEVLEDARKEGLDVSSVEDFRDQANNYSIIEDLMDRYTSSYARYSAIGGSTTGIGGITTSITLGGLELANTAVHLYRLSQRFAILNGFDPEDPLHQDKVYNIYLGTLGFKAATQTAVKYILFRASNPNGNLSVTGRLFSTVITRIARKIGTEISSSNRVAKYIPLVGGAVGAYSSYSYAIDTGSTLKDTFKEQYFSQWHSASPPAG